MFIRKGGYSTRKSTRSALQGPFRPPQGRSGGSISNQMFQQLLVLQDHGYLSTYTALGQIAIFALSTLLLLLTPELSSLSTIGVVLDVVAHITTN